MYIALRYILELVIIIPAIIFAVLPVHDDLKIKSKYAYITGGILAVILVLACAFMRAKYNLSNSEVMIPSGALLFGLYVLLVNAGTGRKLFCVCNSIMLCTFSALYTVFLMAPVEAENELWYQAGVFTLKSGIIYFLLTVIIGAIFFKTLYIKLPMLMKQEYISSAWDFMFLVPLFMAVLMWWSIPLHPDLAMVGRLRPAALIFLWLILMMTLLLYHLFWWTAEKLTEGAELQNQNTLLMMEGKRYEELRNYMDETRALRHDFRQHILVISQLAGSGNFSELQNYLLQFSEGTDKNYTGYCGNIAVDAVASYYTSSAEAQNTRIEWKLNLPHELPIKESEYCVILGNLLENALKAVKNLPAKKRYVKVISSLLSDSLIGISIDNPFMGKIKTGRNGLPLSDSEGHGIGLMSVLNTVKRYRGTMNITEENKIFSVNIILQCNN